MPVYHLKTQSVSKKIQDILANGFKIYKKKKLPRMLCSRQCVIKTALHPWPASVALWIEDNWLKSTEFSKPQTLGRWTGASRWCCLPPKLPAGGAPPKLCHSAQPWILIHAYAVSMLCSASPQCDQRTPCNKSCGCRLCSYALHRLSLPSTYSARHYQLMLRSSSWAWYLNRLPAQRKSSEN